MCFTKKCNFDPTRLNVSTEGEEPLIEPSLWDSLMPFQRDGVRYGLERNGNLLLADDMGLGKTLQSLAIASAYSAKWPLLVVCPSSLRFRSGQYLNFFLFPFY